jgi:hypothetical protein
MRTITDHIANPVNDTLVIEATDEPGAGGAHHRYTITGGYLTNNPSRVTAADPIAGTTILFQNGPIGDRGVNGVTQEALLAVVIDRLRSFQAGPFACPENAEALAHAENALECLKERTRARMARGVEGRNVA